MTVGWDNALGLVVHFGPSECLVPQHVVGDCPVVQITQQVGDHFGVAIGEIDALSALPGEGV
jgi:hypothetical protein